MIVLLILKDDKMATQQVILLVINVLGGVAVIGSYILGFLTHPESRDALWGGVPGWLRPFYGISMILSAWAILLSSILSCSALFLLKYRLQTDLVSACFTLSFWEYSFSPRFGCRSFRL